MSKLPPNHGRSCCQGEPGSLLHRSKHFGTGAVRVDHVALCKVWFHGFGVKASRREPGSGPQQLHGSKRSVGAFGAAFETRPGPVLMFYPCTGICVG